MHILNNPDDLSFVLSFGTVIVSLFSMQATVIGFSALTVSILEAEVTAPFLLYEGTLIALSLPPPEEPPFFPTACFLLKSLFNAV